MQRTPHIPRSEWARHPRFPSQTLLLGSHRSFRRLARDVHRLSQLRRDLAERRFRAWMYGMKSHERYEEAKLYPYLRHRWGVSMQALTEGHVALDRAKVAVFDAFGAARAGSPGADALLRRALERHSTVLDAHLELEEDTVIPLLLELRPDEFADYSMLPIETLLASA